MEAKQGSQERFARREGGKPVLAEAPPVSPGEVLELDAADLLQRLEAQAAENGRLEARAEALESKARAERDARRRLASTLKREREAAASIYQRAEHHRAAHEAALEELERAREEAWSRAADQQRPVATHELGFWRTLFRRPPPGV
jgi:hypothetical protein